MICNKSIATHNNIEYIYIKSNAHLIMYKYEKKYDFFLFGFLSETKKSEVNVNENSSLDKLLGMKNKEKK